MIPEPVIPDTAIPDYETLRKRSIEAIQAYRRDHDIAHYSTVIALFDQIADRAGGRQPRVEDQQLVFDGWLSPPAAARGKRLSEQNPDYRVEVVRYPRLGMGRRARWLRWGFRVRATAPIDAAPFIFRVSDIHGQPAVAAWSNLNVELQQRALEGDPPAPPGRDRLLGYLDSITHAPVPDDRPETWLSALAHEHPAEIHDVLLDPRAERHRAPLADALRLFPTNARWADRYELTARGLAGSFFSDLEPLRVKRYRPGREMAPGGGVPVPEFVREGQIITTRKSGTEFPAPDARWLDLRDVEVQDGGTVSDHRSMYSYERSADPVLDFVAGQWRTVFGSSAHPEGTLFLRHRERAEPIAEGILLAGRNDDNWFHWMVEYLPRVLSVPQGVGADIPVLVSGRVPATGISALRELTDRQIVTIDPDRTTPVGRLHVVAPPVQVLDTTRVPWRDGLSIDPRPLEALRERWALRDLPAPTRRIFIERRSRHRSITNEARLARIARKNGFEVHDPAALGFAEQRELFASAAVLVGGSGAVMSNYLFMQAGSRILALTSEQLADFILPAALAEVVGADFRYLVGRATGLSEALDRNHWIHADFGIDERAFRDALRGALSPS